MALPLLVLGIALLMLHRLSSAVHWADVKADLAATSPWLIVLALGATVNSYATLSPYDIVALGALTLGSVPPALAAAAEASGFAISIVLDASFLIGSSVRMSERVGPMMPARMYPRHAVPWREKKRVEATRPIRRQLGHARLRQRLPWGPSHMEMPRFECEVDARS